MSTAVQAARVVAIQFANDAASLKTIVADVLKYAREHGATACEAEVSEGLGQTVTVRQGEVETIEYNRDKSMGIRSTSASAAAMRARPIFRSQAVRATADAALSIAKFTASDEFAGLADERLLAREIPDLDLYHPWDLPVERAIELARACEGAAFAVDKRITNSEGATVSLQQSHFAYGNSLGFLAGYPSSRHWISCAVIAGKGDEMQRDDWYTSAREPADLDAPEDVGKIAGTRALARLGAKKIATAQVPVLFEAPVAASLLGHFVSAVSGGSLYRKSSFLVDSLGRQMFSPLVEITEDPQIVKGEASARSTTKASRRAGARWSKRASCAAIFSAAIRRASSACEPPAMRAARHNLLLKDTGQDFAALLKQMGRGLLVTEMLGAGHQYGDRRLFARRRRLLGRERRDRLSGAGDHDRRQPERHVPRHRRRSGTTSSCAARSSAARY